MDINNMSPKQNRFFLLCIGHLFSEIFLSSHSVHPPPPPPPPSPGGGLNLLPNFEKGRGIAGKPWAEPILESRLEAWQKKEEVMFLKGCLYLNAHYALCFIS